MCLLTSLGFLFNFMRLFKFSCVTRYVQFVLTSFTGRAFLFDFMREYFKVCRCYESPVGGNNRCCLFPPFSAV